MAHRQTKHWVEARALLQRGRREYLIAKPHGDEECPWEFPGGKLRRGEVAEAGLRRFCRDMLDVELEIQLGQPPFVYSFGTHKITYRYCVCGIRRGEARPQGYAEIRWVQTGQLRDYIFAPPAQQVVDWLLEETPGHS